MVKYVFLFLRHFLVLLKYLYRNYFVCICIMYLYYASLWILEMELRSSGLVVAGSDQSHQAP